MESKLAWLGRVEICVTTLCIKILKNYMYINTVKNLLQKIKLRAGLQAGLRAGLQAGLQAG